MRKRVPSLALLAAAAAAVAGAGPADASFPGRNGLLAVVVGGHPARSAIVLLRADGSVVRRIRGTARYGDTWPAWSPDGRLLAFDAALSPVETRVALVRADGTHRRLLPRPAPFVDAIAPAWLPGGERIGFGATGFDVGGIWTVNRLGRDVHRVSGLGQLPAWSGHGALAVGNGGLGVWRMRGDGTHARQLAGRGSDDPDWSPGAARIAYTRVSRGVEWLWTMRADGAGKRRLARGSMPAWSPDGRSIAFVRGGSLYVIGARGGTPRRVPYAPRDAAGRRLALLMPAWQPLAR